MPVLYLQTAAPPEIAGTDAVFQEIEALKAATDGYSLNIRPIRSRTLRYPRQLFGLHQVARIRELERKSDCTHIFYPIPYFFPFMFFLKKPVIYTISAGFSHRKRAEGLGNLAKIHRVVVSNERDATTLRQWGFSNVSIVEPGIDTTKISPSPLDLGDEMTLLMASAPWVPKQFDLKGVDLLLETVATRPNLKLILLWRGLLFDQLMDRINRLGISDRVEVINEHADINQILKRVHATVLISKTGDIIKAYPHSLVESILAHKPVIASRTIPMSDFIEATGCGEIIESISLPDLVQAIENLSNRYPDHVAKTAAVPTDRFARETMVEKYRAIYKSL